MEQLDNNVPNESEMAIRWYFHLLLSWAWLIVLAGILAGGAAYYFSKRITPTYVATARLLVSVPSAIGGLDPSTGMITLQTLTTTYSQMLLDRSVLEGVIQQLALKTTPDQLAKSISVNAISNTQLLEITVEDPDPQRAADTANAVATVFAARVQTLRSQRYASIREGLVTQVSDMERQIATTSGQIAAMQQELAAAASQKAAVMGTQLAVSATQTVTAMGTQAGTAATQTVTAMQQQIAAAVTQTAAAAPATVEPAALVQLEERLTQYRTLYSNLVLSYEQVRLAEEQTSTNVVVSQSAAVPVQPVGPKKVQITLLAAMVGMLLATGVVLAAERLDDTIRDPEDIRRKFGLPILGVITRHQALEGKPVVLAEPRSPVAEAFRSLRTNITHAAVDRPLRRILITSAMPQDGKTTVACSLAVVLSQNEKRVLLLDADLRRPQVHRRFRLHNRLGLTDLFDRPLDDIGTIIRAVNPPKLAVLTSGGLPRNPAELLTSHMMGQILDALNRDFDLILIDAPPILSVTDAAALAPSMDGVILVARPATTKVGALKQALEQLRAVGARVLGVVLNGVDVSSRRYGYYYDQYSSRYSHYYEAGRPGLASLFRGGAWRKKPGKAASAHSGTRRPKRESKLKMHTGAGRGESEAVAAEGESAVIEAEALPTEQEAFAADPEPVSAEPEAAAMEPEAIAAEPAAVLVGPQVAAMELELVSASPNPGGSGRKTRRKRHGGTSAKRNALKI